MDNKPNEENELDELKKMLSKFYPKYPEPINYSKHIGDNYTLGFRHSKDIINGDKNYSPTLMQLKIHKEYIKYLSSLDPIKLENNMKNFNFDNIKDMNDNDIFEKIKSILFVDGKFNFSSKTEVYKPGQILYRARKLNNYNIPNDKLSCLQDFWNPPKEYVLKPSRLNNIGESLLYTSIYMSIYGHSQILKEINIKMHDCYVICIYKTIKPIHTVPIGKYFNNDGAFKITDKKQLQVHKLICEFMKRIFSVPVDEGNEYLYRLSNLIAKTFYLLPKEDMDAWEYPTVKTENEEDNDIKNANLCFIPDKAMEKLRLVAVCLGIDRDAYNINLFPKYVAYSFDENGMPIYVEAREDEMAELQRRLYT
ncbi:MAG: hypothetical protein VB076_07195 [Synergistaceae bacterium]|nr:hypothetical protein [Synergistaceae bacterium]